MSHKYRLAVLLPTRARTEALSRSIKSLIDLADDYQQIQIMLAFDRDDTVGQEYFKTTLQPYLDSVGAVYTAMLFDPLGYIRLNVYNNRLVEKTDSDWIVIWNDDAVMQTQGWDTEILKYNGDFKLLAFHTHNDHPYSIFPILPRKWYDLLGYISPHPSQDAWLSQQAYLLDIWERIPVWVEHDRFDLTGNNGDETFKQRAMLEGKPNDPDDFHSVSMIELRHRDAAKIAGYLKNVMNKDISFFENVFALQQDPWEKLAQNDVNRQMVQFDNPHNHFNKSHSVTQSK
jgi:hypothetical protein